MWVVFLFQAEDGIRDGRVTGVQTCALPIYRRYRLPPEALNWGGENVLAVRVLGSGGIWSARRSRPPRTWVAEGASRWWTVAVVNWEDEPQDVSLPLATLGIVGAKFDGYDVWRRSEEHTSEL